MFDDNIIFKNFLKALRKAENGIKVGFENHTQLWFPHRSLEGGTDTIAYGHKLTQKEQRYNAFDNGITEIQARSLLLSDLETKLKKLIPLWNKHQPVDWDSVPIKYQLVLLDLVFNVGVSSVSSKERWKWVKLAKAILDNNDQQVYEQSLRSYRRPDGKRVKLTKRSNAICQALGLDFVPVSS